MSGDGTEAAAGLDLRVVGGSPSAAEEAAARAVLTAAVRQLSDEAHFPVGPSAWERSRRMLRGPLTPGAGAWRGFTG